MERTISESYMDTFTSQDALRRSFTDSIFSTIVGGSDGRWYFSMKEMDEKGHRLDETALILKRKLTCTNHIAPFYRIWGYLNVSGLYTIGLLLAVFRIIVADPFV